MRKRILIYGGGGLGREVLTLIKVLDQWEPAGFIDDLLPKGSLVGGFPVLGGHETLLPFQDGPVNLVIAVGDPSIKAKVLKHIGNTSIFYPTLIHPSVILQDINSIAIGAGTIVTAGCILTTDITLGDHILVNLNVTIGHNVSIGNFSSVMPGTNIAGDVKIGEGVLVGSGSNILNRMVLGNGCKVGMGSVVIRDVQAGQTVVGVPAKPVSS